MVILGTRTTDLSWSASGIRSTCTAVQAQVVIKATDAQQQERNGRVGTFGRAGTHYSREQRVGRIRDMRKTRCLERAQGMHAIKGEGEGQETLRRRTRRKRMHARADADAGRRAVQRDGLAGGTREMQ